MTERNKTIDKLRGICMLGVLGIHTGSLVLMSVSPNQHLCMLFEILSRYSVPAFFFVSGYGLFCHYKPGTGFFIWYILQQSCPAAFPGFLH